MLKTKIQVIKRSKIVNDLVGTAFHLIPGRFGHGLCFFSVRLMMQWIFNIFGNDAVVELSKLEDFAHLTATFWI